MDDQLHIPVLGAGRVGDHAAVLPCVLLQRPVEVEAAISSDGMPAARRELGRVRKCQLRERPQRRPASRVQAGLGEGGGASGGWG